MKRFDSIMLKVFLFGFPLFIVLAVFAYFYSESVFDPGLGYVRIINNFAGLIITVWMALLLYLSVRLMISEQFRDQVIVKITFMRERDEREEFLTGKATRATFSTSLAILIFLFCLACFQISIYKLPPDKAVNGKTGMITLGMGFSLLESDRQEQHADTIQKEYIFDYRGLPVSSATIILLIIIWQVGYYNYSMRRLLK